MDEKRLRREGKNFLRPKVRIRARCITPVRPAGAVRGGAIIGLACARNTVARAAVVDTIAAIPANGAATVGLD